MPARQSAAATSSPISDNWTSSKPGQSTNPVVLVPDNDPIHTSKLSLAALAPRAHWLTVKWLPKYAPELNDIEGVWRDLKAHHLSHQSFADAGALNTSILRSQLRRSHGRLLVCH